MDNQEIIKEVKDMMAKIEGSLNLLRQSPDIITYNKLLGMRQKWGVFLQKLIGPDSADESSENSSKNEDN